MRCLVFLWLALGAAGAHAAWLFQESFDFSPTDPAPLAREARAKLLVGARARALEDTLEVDENRVIPLRVVGVVPLVNSGAQIGSEQLRVAFLAMSKRSDYGAKYVYNARFVASDDRDQFAFVDLGEMPYETLNNALAYHPTTGVNLRPVAQMNRAMGRPFLRFANRILRKLRSTPKGQVQIGLELQLSEGLSEGPTEYFDLASSTEETRELLDWMYPTRLCDHLLAARFLPTRTRWFR